ncbi:CD3072 family TudS-related putative desulfidase [Lagierella sp.]|uniref:CD3072 family TudS-related putative desulfidase n=1 Tax=Lagierella sp. TaxID=2849657 RepID=UPI00261197BF|nr:CD3072 family TudS-related putative desulfidase [Lagierella sp.]
MDLRKKKVVFLSHCILNQNTVVEPLARAKGGFNKIIQEILKEDIGIHQMPCPENEFLGLDRNPMTYEEYDKLEGYRHQCKKIAQRVLKSIKEYLKNDYEIIGIIGIHQSPTCSITGKSGVYMEELLKQLKVNNIELRTMEVSSEYVEGKENDLKELIEFLS